MLGRDQRGKWSNYGAGVRQSLNACRRSRRNISFQCNNIQGGWRELKEDAGLDRLFLELDLEHFPLFSHDYRKSYRDN